MTFTSLCPILPCLDLEETRKIYEAIGFKTQGVWEDYGYLIMLGGEAEVHFTQIKDLDPAKNTSAGYLRLADVDGLSDCLAGLGWPDDNVSIPRFGPATDTPWGMRETFWIDPNGNLIRAGVEMADG